jgi:hypothetical protein
MAFVQSFAHAFELGALSGENVCCHDVCIE